jgi:hypothetical protein
MSQTLIEPNLIDPAGSFTMGNLTITGNISVTGNVTTSGNVTATGNVSTSGTLNGSIGTLANVTLGGYTTQGQTAEVVSTAITGATGTVVHDTSTGTTFYHSSIAANFTANFINVPTTNNRTITVALVLVQGSTPYYPSSVQINGTNQTIKWANATAPTPTASRTELVTFSLIYMSSAWTVIGQLGTYG